MLRNLVIGGLVGWWGAALHVKTSPGSWRSLASRLQYQNHREQVRPFQTNHKINIKMRGGYN